MSAETSTGGGGASGGGGGGGDDGGASSAPATSAAAPAPPQTVASSEELEAFWATDMKMMTHIEVPHGATEIPEGALEGCTLVTSIVLPA
jgi:hypothetical protein